MFRWLVNAIFLALPIGSTIGVLLGIQALNSANGKPPPLSNGDKESNSIGIPGLGPIKAKDSIAMKCDDPEGIYSKAPKGLDFSCTLCVWIHGCQCERATSLLSRAKCPAIWKMEGT